MKNKKGEYGFWTFVGILVTILSIVQEEWGFAILMGLVGLSSLYLYVTHSKELKEYRKNWDEIQQMVEWI